MKPIVKRLIHYLGNGRGLSHTASVKEFRREPKGVRQKMVREWKEKGLFTFLKLQEKNNSLSQ